MRAGERVVHVDVAERGEGGREPGIVPLFPAVEAQVLQQQDVAVSQPLRHFRRGRPHAVLGEARGRPAQRPREDVREGTEREGRVDPASGSAEVGHHDDPGARVPQPAQRREKTVYPRGVGDAAVPHGHVQVGADEHPPSGDREVVERRESGHGAYPSLPTAAAVSHMRLAKPHSLSYQDRTRTSLPPTTWVWVRSKVELAGL